MPSPILDVSFTKTQHPRLNNAYPPRHLVPVVSFRWPSTIFIHGYLPPSYLQLKTSFPPVLPTTITKLPICLSNSFEHICDQVHDEVMNMLPTHVLSKRGHTFCLTKPPWLPYFFSNSPSKTFFPCSECSGSVSFSPSRSAVSYNQFAAHLPLFSFHPHCAHFSCTKTCLLNPLPFLLHLP